MPSSTSCGGRVFLITSNRSPPWEEGLLLRLDTSFPRNLFLFVCSRWRLFPRKTKALLCDYRHQFVKTFFSSPNGHSQSVKKPSNRVDVSEKNVSLHSCIAYYALLRTPDCTVQAPPRRRRQRIESLQREKPPRITLGRVDKNVFERSLLSGRRRTRRCDPQGIRSLQADI